MFVCSWSRVFTTQMGLLKVTAQAPAIMLRTSAFAVDDMLGKALLMSGFDDSYLHPQHPTQDVHEKMNPTRWSHARDHNLRVNGVDSQYQTALPQREEALVLYYVRHASEHSRNAAVPSAERGLR